MALWLSLPTSGESHHKSSFAISWSCIILASSPQRTTHTVTDDGVRQPHTKTRGVLILATMDGPRCSPPLSALADSCLEAPTRPHSKLPEHLTLELAKRHISRDWSQQNFPSMPRLLPTLFGLLMVFFAILSLRSLLSATLCPLFAQLFGPIANICHALLSILLHTEDHTHRYLFLSVLGAVVGDELLRDTRFCAVVAFEVLVVAVVSGVCNGVIGGMVGLGAVPWDMAAASWALDGDRLVMDRRL